MKLVVKRKGAMGDLLMITPALKYYKEKNPEHEIYIRTVMGEVFRHNPYVTGTLDNDLDVRKAIGEDDFKYVDLDGVYEEKFDVHPVLVAFMEIVGQIPYEPPNEEYRYILSHSKKDEENAISKMRNKGVDVLSDFYRVYHMGNTWVPIKEEYWDEVIRRNVEVADKIVAVGKGTEYLPKNKKNVILATDLSLSELKVVIINASAFLSTDSGVAHIANMTDTFQTTLFSFVDACLRKPLWDKKNYKGYNITCGKEDKPCAPKRKIIENGEFRGVYCNDPICVKHYVPELIHIIERNTIIY